LEEKAHFPLNASSASPIHALASSFLFSPSLSTTDNSDTQQVELTEKVMKKVECLESQMDDFLAAYRNALNAFQSSDSVHDGQGDLEKGKVEELQHIYHQLHLQVQFLQFYLSFQVTP
jgi:hypothetical protein